jgi:hypothetical protein
MNRYGAMALKHWQTYLPNRYATIEDPNSFFSTLGDQAAQEITDRARELAGPDPAGEEYLDKLGRLNNARMRAEEELLPELVLPDPETQDLAEDEAESETSETSPTPDWMPLVEDPADPRWQAIAEEEADQMDDPTP